MDAAETGGGAHIGRDVESGRDVSGRDSHNVTIQSDGLDDVRAKLLEMAVDIKLLYSMSQERHWQLTILQGWVIMMGIAMFVQSVTFVLFLFFTWR